MIALWKGKNPIYFGVIRSKVKVTVTINRIFEIGLFPFQWEIMWSRLVKNQYTELKLSCGNDPVVKNSIYIPYGRGRTLFILRSLGQRSRSPLL
jgi:hypothetical protein